MAPMDVSQLQTFLDQHFPNSKIVIESVGDMKASIRLPMADAKEYLRPGGTVSGPTLMTLADTAMYIAILAEIGPVALAVTTNLNINFMRKPKPVDVIANAEILKLGSRLAIGDVRIYSKGSSDVVAHATCTYSIPPNKG